MGKRAKAIIIVLIGVIGLGVIAALAAPVIYRSFFVQPAAEAPTLSAEEPALESGPADAGALDPASISGEWIVGDGSYAGYRVDEMLNGDPVTVTGRTDTVTGSLLLDGLTLQSAEFTVDVASITTDNPQRDRYFRDQALNASAHPTATFTLTAPATIEAAPASGEVIEQTLSGDLTLAGVTQPVSFTAQLRSNGSTAEIVGQIPITFADFGVAAPRLGFVSVEPTGFVEFLIVAQQN